MKRGLLLSLSAVTATTMLLGACSDDKKPKAADAPKASTAASAAASQAAAPAAGGKPVKVAYQRFGDGRVMDTFLEAAKADYEAANPGSTMELTPIVASGDDYTTKLALLMKDKSTAPDIVHEDTYRINSDIEAGFLKPLDDYIGAWDQWSQYHDNAKNAGKALDGKTYGIPDGTDTRGLWYNKEMLTKAGIAVPWAPKTWDDVLAAARAVKEKVPGVTPINVYASKGAGEATSMQGFEMLLYGTGGSLYDAESKKWIVGSKQFVDALGFIKAVYSEKLGPAPQIALDPKLGNLVREDLLPNQKLAIALDGSWLPGTWKAAGGKPWPNWPDVLDVTGMPTQTGQEPGHISLSGGWTWAIPAKSDNSDAAWKVIQHLQNPKYSARYTNDASQIAVRKDVGDDGDYKKWTGQMGALSEVVAVTQYRPAYGEYPRISNEIQVAAESVMTGQASPEKAAKTFDDAVKRIVGDDKTVTK
ncbi:MAG: extracellular solute-binding protein [Mycobacteriales bacterium]